MNAFARVAAAPAREPATLTRLFRGTDAVLARTRSVESAPVRRLARLGFDRRLDAEPAEDGPVGCRALRLLS